MSEPSELDVFVRRRRRRRQDSARPHVHQGVCRAISSRGARAKPTPSAPAGGSAPGRCQGAEIASATNALALVKSAGSRAVAACALTTASSAFLRWTVSSLVHGVGPFDVGRVPLVVGEVLPRRSPDRPLLFGARCLVVRPIGFGVRRFGLFVGSFSGYRPGCALRRAAQPAPPAKAWERPALLFLLFGHRPLLTLLGGGLRCQRSAFSCASFRCANA